MITKIFRIAAISGTLLTLSVECTSAQISMGVGFGLNYTDVDDVELESGTAVYDSRQGLHFGLFADMNLWILSVRPGAYYVNAGPVFSGGLEQFLCEGDACTQPVISDFDVRYISVPIDVRFKIGIGIMPYLFAGPEFRFDISDAPEGLELASTTYTVNIGGGVEFALAGMRLMPEARFSFDVSPILGDTITFGNIEFMAEEDHRMRMFMLRLGIGL